MQLYMCTSRDFISAAAAGHIAEKLKDAFLKIFHHAPSVAEVRSWQGGLARLGRVLENASLLDQGMLLEYQLPGSSKRVDCIIAGLDHEGSPSAVIIELKQWSEVFESDVEDCVTINIGSHRREVLHPSKQVGNYQDYMESLLPIFESSEIKLSSCSFLYKLPYKPHSPLLIDRYRWLLDKYPLFMSDQTQELARFLKNHVGRGHGLNVVQSIIDMTPTESNNLFDNAKAVISGYKPVILLDEQQVVYDEVLAKTRASIEGKEKAVFLIKGEPGSGKSLIALKLLAELSSYSHNVHYASASRVFTEKMRSQLGSTHAPLFKYFSSYTGAASNVIDILILDDAHRLRPYSHDRYNPSNARSGFSQAKELIEAAKTTVFFVDERQVIGLSEVGDAETIHEAASASGAKFYQYELKGQFRFNGSDEYPNWIDHTLGVRRTETALWMGTSAYDFRIVNNPIELESLIRAKHESGFLSRMTAGLCWPWSNPDNTGQLPCDVVVGDWAMPWVARPESKSLANGIPKATEWAVDPAGVNQLGNIYTVQGLEFDYVGLIFGRDLRYDLTKDLWIGDKSQSHDVIIKRPKDEFVELVRNAYRILLTRGSKGCYVYFMDKDTRKFFESRISY